MINVKEVHTKSELTTFVDFPHQLYKNDANYVPELFIAQRDLLTPGKHPFHEHSGIQLFLAYDDLRLVGRIGAIINNNHNNFNKVTDGFFGFFDCVDNEEIAAMLFTAAAKWLKDKGAKNMIGPVNPSTNEPCGMLIDGFDKPPVAMTVYNKPYYNQLLEAYGFTKNVDLLAYDIPIENIGDRPLLLEKALTERLSRRNIVIRHLNLKDFKNEVVKLRAVYNAAWDKNMGFVPFTDSEFNYLAKDLKLIVDSKLCLIAEDNGKTVGFALAIPDINQILIKVKRGRLLPTGIVKLLMGMKRINNMRVLALGVIEGYKKQGIEACFYAGLIKRGMERNMRGCEASWILEHNEPMNRGIQSINGKVYKKYRIYKKEIA